MKLVLTVLCLAASFLSTYGVTTERLETMRSWSLAEPVLFVIGCLFLLRMLMGTWKLDAVSVFQALTPFLLILSGLLNNALSNGTLLNFVRTSLAGAVLYITMLNVIRGVNDLRRFSWLCLLAAFIVYAISIPTLATTWRGGFTNIFFVFGMTDLNSFGFLYVLLFCASAPLWLSDQKLWRGFLIAGFLASGAMLSLSRSAWSNIAVASLVGFMVRDTRSKGRGLRVIGLGLGLLAAFFVFTFVADRLPGAREFGAVKVNDYGDDAVRVRLLDLTLRPLQEWIHEPVSTLVLGDAISFQHTFIANALWVSGILGLICGVGVYTGMMLQAVRAWRSRTSSIPGYRMIGACYAALVIVMFLDDSITNHRFHSQLLSYLFYASAGAFAGCLRNQKAAAPAGSFTVIGVRQRVPAPV